MTVLDGCVKSYDDGARRLREECVPNVCAGNRVTEGCIGCELYRGYTILQVVLVCVVLGLREEFVQGEQS